jgi:hypothetical protein
MVAHKKRRDKSTCSYRILPRQGFQFPPPPPKFSRQFGARAQVGDLSAEIVWRELVDGLPKGLPAPGDRGLDNTHTWGRTYWGGALFCLMADLEIHRRTNNRFGLQDALRGIVRAGGNMEHDWQLTSALGSGR